MPETTHSYVEFIESPWDKDDGRKTSRWRLRSKTHEFLGEVRWYAPWRRYVFYPRNDALFDANCLWDIADFVAKETEKRKEARAKEKKNAIP